MALLPYTLAVNRSLNRLAEIERGALVKIATDLVETVWIRNGFWHAKETDLRILGRFDLEGPDGRTPWPSVLIELRRRPQHKGQSDRKAIVAVYLNDAGVWEVSERQSEVIPWGQYRGSREGKPSVLNGDRPADSPDPLA